MKRKAKTIAGTVLLSLVLFSASSAQAGYWGAWRMTKLVSLAGYIVCDWEQIYYSNKGERFYSVVKTTKGWWSCPRP